MYYYIGSLPSAPRLCCRIGCLRFLSITKIKWETRMTHFLIQNTGDLAR